MMVANTGTAALEDVKLAGTAPTGWEVSFEPDVIAGVKPNETAQVTAIIKPAKDAVAGDYALTVRSSAGSQSSQRRPALRPARARARSASSRSA